jgi:hypothetical protein
MSIRSIFIEAHTEHALNDLRLCKIQNHEFCENVVVAGHYFSPLNTFMRKRKDPELDPDPHL